jgi:multidrug efflux pump subunit AcrB
VVYIVAVLLLLFRNWVDPLVIVLALPLAVVGAVFALLLVHSEFGMISLIGVVFLFGLVNKNAILLVDYINQLRASGLGCMESILTAGPVRLRPILMTTLATILGMMPVAIGLGVGSELRAPMAVAIIGGLVTSTLLSLIVVPVVYVILDPWRHRREAAKQLAE